MLPPPNKDTPLDEGILADDPNRPDAGLGEPNHHRSTSDPRDGWARLVFPHPNENGIEESDGHDEVIGRDLRCRSTCATATLGPDDHGVRHTSRHGVRYLNGRQGGSVGTDWRWLQSPIGLDDRARGEKRAEKSGTAQEPRVL